MAQNITIAGASFSDVPAIVVPKTGSGSATFLDTTISSSAATASDIASGKLAYVNGSLITGTASGGGGATNFVSGTFTGSSSGALTISLNYSGNGYPVACIIFPSAGVYTDSTYYNTIQRYAIGFYSMTKSDTATTPTYSSSGTANYGTTLVLYKSSTSSATSFSRTGSQTVNVYSSSSASSSNSTCVRFRSATSMSVYIASTSYGFMSGVTYTYYVIYSS